MADSIIIIPTYNERENIENLVRKIFSLPNDFDILIVDDNSPDGTSDAVVALQSEFKDRLFLIKRHAKLGLGTAYIHGFKWALERHYNYIFEMDGDFSHNPDDIMKLYYACCKNGADLSIGSRYIKGVNVVNWPLSRILLSFFASKYVRLITGIKIKDTTAGFICYTRKVLEAINFDNITFIGYAFQIEMKYTAWKLGFIIFEIPIIFIDRKHGQSKMSKGIFNEAVLGVIKLRFRNIKKLHKK